MIQFSSVARVQPLANLQAAGVARFVLVGDVVTMDAHRTVLPGGRICLEGNAIAAVVPADANLPADLQNAPVVRTEGTIYPGLFDLHNHLPYNHIPFWQLGAKYSNRLEWQNIAAYYPAVTAPYKLLNQNSDPKYPQAIARHAECRGLFGGVTTGHGMGSKAGPYAGLMRNVEAPGVAGLPQVKSHTPDFDDAELKKMVDWTGQGQPFVYHLSEGVGDYGAGVFRYLQNAAGGLNKYLTCIHAVGVPDEGWDAMRAVAGVVWSPTSNLLLYGQTCNVSEAKRRGIRIAIGADWAPSGCKNILGELKVARATSQHMGGVLTDSELVAGVTCVPAAMIGWDKQLGSIEAGKLADLLVLRGAGGDHYARLIEAKETSIRAVVIDGRVRLGEDDGLVLGDPLSTEAVSIGGKAYVLDLAEPDAAGSSMKLSDALATISYGLAHLPDLEAGQRDLALMGNAGEDNEYSLDDEMLPQRLFTTLLSGNHLPAKPMALAPLTAVDDPAFKAAVQANPNMPDYAKAVFND